jgi:hypothetical protein
MHKTYNNKLGFFSPVKLLDFQNALIEIDFENAFNNTDCPLSLEQSESTEYVNNLFNRGDSRYEG